MDLSHVANDSTNARRSETSNTYAKVPTLVVSTSLVGQAEQSTESA